MREELGEEELDRVVVVRLGIKKGEVDVEHLRARGSWLAEQRAEEGRDERAHLDV